ncbi:MAG TPA: hypothetical protein VNJ01_16605 [Bacteriovoracaceae bacterium]|nr:hypothetical protein [Bacteriovoracaceae bacterium]
MFMFLGLFVSFITFITTYHTVQKKYLHVGLSEIAWLEVSLISFSAYGMPALAAYLCEFHPMYLDLGTLVKEGGVIGLGIGAAFLLPLYLQTRRPVEARRIFLKLLRLTLLAIPISGVALYSDLNQLLDRSEASKHTVEIFEPYQVRDGRGSAQKVDIKPDPKIYYLIPRSLEISYPLYQKIKHKQRVEIEIYPGFFNRPWIESMK